MFGRIRLGFNTLFVGFYVYFASISTTTNGVCIVTLILHSVVAILFFICCTARERRICTILPEVWALPPIYSLVAIWLVVMYDRGGDYYVTIYGHITYLFLGVYVVSSVIPLVLTCFDNGERNIDVPPSQQVLVLDFAPEREEGA